MKMPRRLKLAPDERQRLEREVRNDRVEGYRYAVDDVVRAAVKYHAKLGRDDGLHQARLSKLRSHLDNMIRWAAETMPWQPVTDDDIRKLLARRDAIQRLDEEGK